MSGIYIPKPPEQGDKPDKEYIQELKTWSFKIYDALRYMSESAGGTSDGKL